MIGETTDARVQPDRGDRRFLDPEWGSNAFFDFLKQAYLITRRAGPSDLVEDADDLDEHTRQGRLLRQADLQRVWRRRISILTNPELLRETVGHQRREPRARHEDARRGHRGGAAAI